MCVGEASIVIIPDTEGFKAALDAESQSALGGFKKDSELAGEEAGANLRGGVKKETGKLGEDLEKDGTKGGEGLSKGMSGGLSKLAGVLGTIGLPLGGLGGKLHDVDGAAASAGESAGGLAEGLGAAAGPAAAVAVGLGIVAVASLKASEGVTSSEVALSHAAGISAAAGKAIGDSFLDTAFKSEFSGKEMIKAYAGVAGQLKETEGHALSNAEATQFMTAAQNLAEASGGELNSTTEALSKTMQAFGMSTQEAGKGTDILYSASNATNMSVEALAGQLAKMKSKLGDQSGSLGQLAGELVAFTKAGITGRTSTSDLSTSLSTLQGKSTATTEEIAKLGIHVDNEHGKFIGLGGVVDQLAPKFDKMSGAQKHAAAEALFGKAAAEGMLAVIKQGPGAFEAQTKAVEKQGTAQKAATAQGETLHGELKTLSSGVNDLAVMLGQKLEPVMTKAVAGVVKFVAEVKNGSGTVGKATHDIGDVFSALLPVVERAVEGMIHTFEGIVQGMEGVVHIVKGVFTLKFGEVWKGVEQIFSGGVKAALGIFEGMLAPLEAIGKNIIGGLIKGIESGIAKLESVVHKVASIPGKIVSLVNEIASPSKVMEGHGEMLSLGLAEGIKKGAPHAIAASLSVSQQIMAFWEEHGFSAAAAAGFVGNAKLESGLNPGEAGGGLYQQSGDGASGAGVSGSVAQQSQAVRERLPPGLAAALKKIGDPAQAAHLIALEFERAAGTQPGEPGYGTPEYGTAHVAQREAAARQAFGGAGAAAGSPAQRVADQKAALDKEVAATKAALAEWVAKMQAEAKTGTAAQKAAIAQAIADKKAETAKIIADEKAGLTQRQATEKVELQKQTSDKKTGESLFGKLQTAVQEGSLKQLNTTLNKTHEQALSKVEKDLDNDHKTALAKLSADLVKVHREALAKQATLQAAATAEAVKKASEAQTEREVKAHDEQVAEWEANEKARTDAINKGATITAEQGADAAQAIADATKVTLDKQAETGLTGTELIAAHLQTVADEVTATANAEIGAAKLNQDQTVGAGAVAEAQAAALTVEVEAKAKVREAEAQAREELARGGGSSGSPTESPSAPATGINIENLTISAPNSPGEILTQFGWALKTGNLPVAQPVPV